MRAPCGLPTFSNVPLAATLTPPTGFAVFYIPSHFHEDTTTMWNAGVQREVRSTVAELCAAFPLPV